MPVPVTVLICKERFYSCVFDPASPFGSLLHFTIIIFPTGEFPSKLLEKSRHSPVRQKNSRQMLLRTCRLMHLSQSAFLNLSQSVFLNLSQSAFLNLSQSAFLNSSQSAFLNLSLICGPATCTKMTRIRMMPLIALLISESILSATMILSTIV